LLQLGWKMLFLNNDAYQPQNSQSAEWNRGAYLVLGLIHCSECHTPRNFLGASDMSKFLSGTPDGPAGEAAPNITPD